MSRLLMWNLPSRSRRTRCSVLTYLRSPQGAVLARPHQLRAGEEVHVAKALATSHVPILKVLTGQAVFEGADLMWLDERTALIGRGHRTTKRPLNRLLTNCRKSAVARLS